MPGTAFAQAPDTAPPDALIKIDTTLNSLDSVTGNGLVFSLDPSEDLATPAPRRSSPRARPSSSPSRSASGRSTTKSGGYIEQSFLHGGDGAVKTLQKIRKATKLAVTVTLDLVDTAGN